MKKFILGITTNDNRYSNFLGFNSFADFLESLLRTRDWIVNLFAAIIASVTTFITGYMWDSHQAVYVLWIIMGVDWITGIGKSVKNKNFESYRVFRMPVFYIVTSFIVSITWWMAKTNIIFIPLPAIAMGGFYMVYFSSFIENIAELEWLPKKAIFFLKKIGMKVIIDKYFPKEKIDEDKSN